MRVFRNLTILGLTLAVAVAVRSVDGGEKQKKGKFVEGTVVEIQRDKDTEQGHVIVKVKPKKKIEAQVLVREERKIRLSKTTSFVKLQGKKAQGTTEPATFADVQKGAEVLIMISPTDPSQAERIALVRKKKKADTAD